jgi:hypothetical protein
MALRPDVTVLVEDGERLSGLQDLVVQIHDLGGGLDLVADGIELARRRGGRQLLRRKWS